MKNLLLQSLSIMTFVLFLASCEQPSIEPIQDLTPTTSEKKPQISTAVEEVSLWSTIVGWFI